MNQKKQYSKWKTISPQRIHCEGGVHHSAKHKQSKTWDNFIKTQEEAFVQHFTSRFKT